MRTHQPYNGLLWLTNAALGAVIVLFFFKHLLPPADYTRDVRLDDARDAAPLVDKTPLSDSSLQLKNPITVEEGRLPLLPDGGFSAVLKGTLPRERGDGPGTVFLRSATSPAELVAFVGEKIMYGAKEFSEYSGWTLSDVWKDRAVFKGPNGRTRQLTLEPEVVPASTSRVCLPGRGTP